jgi:hypothetical protein
MGQPNPGPLSHVALTSGNGLIDLAHGDLDGVTMAGRLSAVGHPLVRRPERLAGASAD